LTRSSVLGTLPPWETMNAGRRSKRGVMIASAIALCGCGSSSSADGVSSTDASESTESPDAAAALDGPQASWLDAASTAPAPLGCTGAWLDQNTWDSCPELDGTGPNCTCYGYAPDAGTLTYDDSVAIFNVNSFLLPLPMTAGQPYAFSVVVSDNRFYGDIELWGTNATCGPGLERLYAAPLASQTYCVNVVPSQNYPYVIFVQRLAVDSGAPASESATQFMACPTDHCP
jgi:hypothetical protein